MTSSNGRVSTRYEVGHCREGLIATAPTFEQAADIAIAWWSSPTGYDDAEEGVSIFDSMARSNQPETWKFVNGRWQVVGLRVREGRCEQIR